jgi:hypothetical protein
MPLAGLVQSRVIRFAVLALLALPLGIGAAAGSWQPVPRGASSAVRITGNRVVGLYPSTRKELHLTLHNSNRSHNVLVDRLRVRDVGTTKKGCLPSRRNLAIRQYRRAPIRIPPGGARKVTVLLYMPNTVAQACQRAVFRLRYRAHTR